MPDRSGKRKTREQFSKRRIPELGYYFIVTDTKETEQNYMLGLRDSIPKELQGKIVIKVCEAKTVELVSEAINMASLQPQYGEPWIVFDRDQVKDFDRINCIRLRSYKTRRVCRILSSDELDHYFNPHSSFTQ